MTASACGIKSADLVTIDSMNDPAAVSTLGDILIPPGASHPVFVVPSTKTLVLQYLNFTNSGSGGSNINIGESLGGITVAKRHLGTFVSSATFSGTAEYPAPNGLVFNAGSTIVITNNSTVTSSVRYHLAGHYSR